ncbi:MAG: hypothetical protein HUN04_25750 [Desulfobacter sp.]|nr:MAG: hypothetical protein HUN04_25750 [Desulfobacter sp.]
MGLTNRKMLLGKHRWKTRCLGLATGILVALAVTVAGTETAVGKTIQQGDTVLVNYTCRAPGYGIFDTTDPAVADNAAEKKARIFIVNRAFAPVPMVAGHPVAETPPNEIEFFADAVLNRLSKIIVGKQTGKSYAINLEADIPPNLQQSQRYLNFNKVERSPRNRTAEKEKIYPFLRGRALKTGTVLTDHTGHDFAKIYGIEGDTVSYRMINAEGLRQPHTVGESFFSEDGDDIVMTIETKIGLPVRSGGLLGQVSRITDEKIVADFAHPFAGKTLACDVVVKERVR